MADYKPDYRETASFMRGPEMRAMVEVKAHEAMAFAKSISPDAPPYGEGYIASFDVSVGVEQIRTRRGPSRRAVATLSNNSDHAVEVELGVRGDKSRADTGHHVLARTVDFLENG